MPTVLLREYIRCFSRKQTCRLKYRYAHVSYSGFSVACSLTYFPGLLYRGDIIIRTYPRLVSPVGNNLLLPWYIPRSASKYLV